MSTFIAFSWIFVSRSVMGCREDSRGYVSEGRSKHEGAVRGDRRALGVGKPLESVAGLGVAFLRVEGWSALLRVEGSWGLQKGRCEAVCAGPLWAAGHGNAGLVGVEDKSAETVERNPFKAGVIQ